MADARSVILHHYEGSPFAEKIRLALRLKNLAWHSVDAPVVMPKPELTTLTGGYRRIPVLQLGADIYCDTSIILRELDRRFEVPTLTLPGHEGFAAMVGAWADTRWFQTSVGVVFGALGNQIPEAFIADREKLMERPFNVTEMQAAAPVLRDQWRAQLMWIEERLAGGRGAGAGNYLIATKAGLVDVQAYFNVWFVERNVPDFLETCFQRAPLTRAWYQRLKEEIGQAPTPLSADAALDVAKSSAPRLIAATTGADAQGLRAGNQVAVAPDDYGKDWVEGALVHADAQRIIISRQDERIETVNVHFPRAGYLVRKLAD